MKRKELSELTDEELLQEAKKRKSNNLVNALLIGFLIGIVFYGVIKSSVSFFALLPLFLVYKLANKSKLANKELEGLLKERNLK